MTSLDKTNGRQDRAAEVAKLLKILSHPNRLRIACEVLAGEKSVSEIEAKTGVRQPVLSRDLARLREAGLVATRRESKMVFYRIADARLADLVGALCRAFSTPQQPVYKAIKTRRTNSRQTAGRTK